MEELDFEIKFAETLADLEEILYELYKEQEDIEHSIDLVFDKMRKLQKEV